MHHSAIATRHKGALRAFVLAAQLVLIFLGLLLPSRRAQAYPWMIKHGYANCATCHSDPSGGELLTGYGRVLSAEFLSTQWHKSEVANDARTRKWALRHAAHSKSAGDVKAPPAPTSATSATSPTSPTTADPAPTNNATTLDPTQPGPNPNAPTDSAAPSPDAPPEPNTGAPGTAPPNVAPGTGEAGAAVAPADAPVNATTPAAEPAEPAETPEAEPEAAPKAEPPHGAEGHEFFQPFFGAVRLPENLLLGGSLRFATLYTKDSSVRWFPMQLDLYGDLKLFDFVHVGGSIGAAKVKINGRYTQAAQVTHARPDELNLISRTHYLRFDFGDGAHSISVGRLNLPFGIRMSEHTMWVRYDTLTDRTANQEHGASLNMNFDSWRFELMAIAGNYQINPDALRKRGYSGYAEWYAWDGGAVGVSSLITHAERDINRLTAHDNSQAHGAFVRSSLGHELVLLSEGDVILHTDTEPGYAGYAQLDFEPLRGLHVIGTGEIHDIGYSKIARGDRTPGYGHPGFGGWLSSQWFFISHFDFRVDAIARQNAEFQLLGQIHVYL